MHLGSWGQGMVVSGVLLGAMIGSLVIGPSSDRYGRRKLLLLSSIIFIIGGLGCAFASNALILILFRVVLGLAVGAASSMVPTYLAELSPAVKRGVVSSLFQVMVMTGIFLAYVVNWGLQGFYTGWRWMLVGCPAGYHHVLRGAFSPRISPLPRQNRQIRRGQSSLNEH